jgi:acetyltransferase-like isoleucine patch superfamily enzyme
VHNQGDVALGKAALGTHTVILPGTMVGDAASVGALCVVSGTLPPGAAATVQGRGLAVKGTRDVGKTLRMCEEVLKKDGEAEDLYRSE